MKKADCLELTNSLWHSVIIQSFLVIIGLVGILVLAVRVRILLPQPLTNPTASSRPFSTTHLYERCVFFVRAMEKKT